MPMCSDEFNKRRIEVRLVLLHPTYARIAVLGNKDSFKLPLISISLQARPTEQLQLQIQRLWSMSVCVIDFLLLDHDQSCCAILEILSSGTPSELAAISLSELSQDQLRDSKKEIVREIALGRSGCRGPFSRCGWFHEARDWVSKVIEPKSKLTGEFRQFNAAGHFSLIRFSTTDGVACWLKATGEPNRHEYHFTERLAQLCPEGLPRRIAARSDWKECPALSGIPEARPE
jgi:hypothetical protein